MLSENMASLGGEQVISKKDLSDSTTSQQEIRPSSVEKKSLIRDRDEKLRIAKERQNEERQRKIEELRAQAEAAQKYREQKDGERRRKIEELRHKDNDRRQQVEERKKAIIEAEKERREYILRKNQEREARLDTKKRNERSSIAFAFGSSTPRLLDPAELGNVSPSTYLGHRRSTSITNVAYTGAPLTRRSSERDLLDGSKKRATSAGGIDRQNDEETATTETPPISYRSVARRKTDLMPTIPSPRESSFGSKTSLHSHTPRTPGSRSGDVTPGGSINTSRPGSAMSTSTTASGLVQRRTLPPTRKPRPASIAVTGVSLNDELNKQKKDKPPLPKLQSTPKRASLSNSNSVTKISSTDSIKRSSTKKESLTPKPKQSTENKNAISKPLNFEKTDQAKESDLVSILDNQNSQTKEEKEAINAVKTESILMNNEIISVTKDYNEDIQPMAQQLIDINIEEKVTAEEKIDNDTEKDSVSQEVHVFKEPSVPKEIPESVPVPSAIPIEIRELSVERQDNEMTASMIARKITTEEQAKAALAERRKIAREEAERQAELEKQRLEAERQAEIQRIAEEEERQRKFEEETLRLAEEQRKSEEERLLQAIEEATKREEAEKLKREEDEKLKIEREEAEKKAKEEAEKQRLEVAERLKREEKEREERRKRVEAIMSRTRAKGGGNSTPNSTPTKDNDEKSDKIEDEKATNQQLDNNSQFNENENNKMEESSQIVEEISIIPQQQPQSQQDEELQKPDQTFYEKSVTEKENALMKTFSNMMIVDENSKNYQNFQNPLVEVTNGKTLSQNQKTNEIVSHSIANGNGHIENLNKNDTNTLVDISSTITDQLIDFANESQQIADVVNCNNNNSLITSSATTTLVTSDSHENKEISLL